MKYIFVAGAPGSKWSSVVKNIYTSLDIDSSDTNEQRSYAHAGAYNGRPMHIGSYFDPGMEFGNWFNQLDQYTKEQCEAEFDKPFSGNGIRIIKSHMFMHHIGFLKKYWPDCPIVLVHRSDDACLGWWVRCGGFNISYPDYNPYYKNLDTIAQEITKQNAAMMPYWDSSVTVTDNLDLCNQLNIALPQDKSYQNYISNDIQVRVF
jgi:hypothetical protein